MTAVPTRPEAEVTASGSARERLSRFFQEVASPPLAAIGMWALLALALHPVAVRFLTPGAEDTLRFVLLGFGIPAIGLWWALRWPGSGVLSRPPVAALLSLAGAAAGSAAVVRYGLPSLAAVFALALLQAVALSVFGVGRKRSFALLNPVTIAAGFVGWAAALAGATNALALGLGAMLPATAAVAVPLLLVPACWWGSGAADRIVPRLASLVIDALAILLIVVLSIRTTGLFVSPGYEEWALGHHHWSFIAGPIMLMREGGWLLWDIPAPYGFLSYLTLAALPVASPWQAVYIFTAALTPFMFIAVYLVMRSVWRSIPGQLFALLVAIGLFFTIFDNAAIIGRQFFPSAGPFRFLWPLVLLGLLAVERRMPAGGSAQRRILLLGSAAWLLGVLWSFESAFYSSAVWLPGYLIVVFRDRVGPCAASDAPDRIRQALFHAAGWLLLPVGLLLPAAGLIAAIYMIGLGRLPDLRAYVDYALAYNGADVARQLGWIERVPLDGLYLPVIAIVAGSFAVIAVIIRRVGWPREIGLLIGAVWSSWAWSSYILSRKDPLGLYISLPMMAVAISLLLRWLANHPGVVPSSLGWAYRALALPTLVVVALAIVGRPALVGNTIAAILQPASWRMADIDRGLPDLDPELAALLAAAGAAPGDPVLAVTRPFSVIEIAPPPPPGAPRSVASLTGAQPAGLTAVLAPERRQVYMQRWADRHPRGGWVIQRKQGDVITRQFLDDTGPWFWEQLFRTHVPTRALASEHWDLLWVEPAPPDIPRPALAAGRWMFDDDRVVVSAPDVLASWADPAVPERRGSSALVPDGSILNLYSDEPRAVRIVVEGRNHRGFDLALDGDPAGSVDPANDRRNAVDLTLSAGWSRLTFTAGAPIPGADAGAQSRVIVIRIEPATGSTGKTSDGRGKRAGADPPAENASTAPASEGARATPGAATREPDAGGRRFRATPSPAAAESGDAQPEATGEARARKRDRNATPVP